MPEAKRDPSTELTNTTEALSSMVAVPERLKYELMGIEADVVHGNGFDSVCLQTLRRVIDALAKGMPIDCEQVRTLETEVLELRQAVAARDEKLEQVGRAVAELLALESLAHVHHS